MNMNDYLTMSASDFGDDTARWLLIGGLVVFAIGAIMICVAFYAHRENLLTCSTLLLSGSILLILISISAPAQPSKLAVSDIATAYGITIVNDGQGHSDVTKKSRNGEIIVLPAGIDTDEYFTVNGDNHYDIAYVKHGAHDVSTGTLVSHDYRFGILENNADGTSTTLEPAKSHKNVDKSRKRTNMRARCYVKSYNTDGSVKELAGDCQVGTNH